MTDKRKVLKGLAVSSGIVLGHARVMIPGNVVVPEVIIPISKLGKEISALDRAIEETIVELRTLRDSAGKKMGGPVAKIFDAQLLIASDSEFLGKVKNEISAKKRNAAFVYNSEIINATSELMNSTDAYMRQMALDIDAVAQKVLRHLSGRYESQIKFSPNTILVGRLFSPGEILTYRQRKAIGFVVSEGGRNSHMALISRALLLPVIVAANAFNRIPDDSRIIIDGTTGTVIVNPTDKDWSDYQRLKKRQGPTLIRRIKKLPHVPPVTKDGKKIGLGANLTLPGPADELLAERKIPVGLYRTEFLYLAGETFPDEEEQFQYYSQIAERFSGSSVVLRTFDLGYDKLAANTTWAKEDNPALGWRGIRPMLDMTQIFKTQIRAILRASGHSNFKIMLPMISDISELVKAKRLISQVKLKLKQSKIKFDENIEVGVMVEVPSAAMTAEALAQKVDFISIGTNDLAQYTLAADRMNSKVAYLYSAYHPAVLNLIKKTVDACKLHKIPVSICGEVAGDLLGLPLFIGMGVDMFSMNPSRIVDFCRMVSRIDSNLVKHMVTSVLSSGSLSETTRKLEHFRSALNQRK